MRVSLALIGSIALGIANPQAIKAQVTSNTWCSQNGQSLNCTTRTQPDPMSQFNKGIEDMQSQLRRMQEAREQRAASELAQRGSIEASNRAYIRKRVGELAAAGDCQNARSMAAANGEFQLHSEVDAFCKAAGR